MPIFSGHVFSSRVIAYLYAVIAGSSIRLRVRVQLYMYNRLMPSCRTRFSFVLFKPDSLGGDLFVPDYANEAWTNELSLRRAPSAYSCAISFTGYSRRKLQGARTAGKARSSRIRCRWCLYSAWLTTYSPGLC